MIIREKILRIGKGATQGLGNTALTTEAKYSINFSRSNRKLQSLHYNESDSFIFLNATKLYQFKVKDSETKKYQLCLGNVSKDFSVNNKNKTGLNVHVYNFSFDHGAFDISGITDIYKYLMKKHDIK